MKRYDSNMKRYDSNMDKECIELCNALNSVQGIRTFESCCGHAKAPMRIWFYSSKNRPLFIIAKSINRMYGGPISNKSELKEWTCILTHNDVPERPVFFLESPSKGRKAYKQAKIIANNISELLKG